MSKEFSIDDYVYVEERLPFFKWLQDYKPQPNHINPEARLSGLLYENEGEQKTFILQLPVYKFWSVYEDSGKLFIRNGYQVRGHIGYVVCQTQHNAHATFIVDGLTEDMLEHKLGEH